jgi:UDP-N-acetyl-D-glucosamine dehydrogenase
MARIVEHEEDGMSALTLTRQRLANLNAVVSVIGLGYVGLPQATAFAEAGFRVLGFDIDESKAAVLNRGESYILDVSSDRVTRLVEQGRLSATSDPSRLSECDAAVICVPTPLSAHREPDLSAIDGTVRSVATHLRPGHLIVLVSTTYPGTTEERVLPVLESTGLTVGRDFALGYAPEREDPGNFGFRFHNTPKLVAGCTPVCRDLTEALYRPVVEKVIPVPTTRVAEAAKLLENVYRAVNIALVNELKLCFQRMDIDVWDVIDAAATKPFGFTPFYPGPGLGGHCIPLDPFYLTWKAREHGFHTRFIELAGDINTGMPEHVVAALRAALDRRGVTLRNARILILGVAYKRDTADTRESPALEIISMLNRAGAVVSYHDPFVARLGPTRRLHVDLASTPLSEDLLRGSDAVVIVTDHSGIDYHLVVRHAPVVVDTRNATRHVSAQRQKIVKA